MWQLHMSTGACHIALTFWDSCLLAYRYGGGGSYRHFFVATNEYLTHATRGNLYVAATQLITQVSSLNATTLYFSVLSVPFFNSCIRIDLSLATQLTCNTFYFVIYCIVDIVVFLSCNRYNVLSYFTVIITLLNLRMLPQYEIVSQKNPSETSRGSFFLWDNTKIL